MSPLERQVLKIAKDRGPYAWVIGKACGGIPAHKVYAILKQQGFSLREYRRGETKEMKLYLRANRLAVGRKRAAS